MENKGELIVAIVNKGYSDLVMAGAIKGGARGGTIFNAHGTGNPEMEKYFGVPIHPEKEMVFIIVDKAIKDQCLLNIYKEAGLESKGQGIAFSLPVEDMVGFTPIEKEETKTETK